MTEASVPQTRPARARQQRQALCAEGTFQLQAYWALKAPATGQRE